MWPRSFVPKSGTFTGVDRLDPLKSSDFWKLLCVVLTLSGCVSARVSDRESDRLFLERHYDEAAERLARGAEKEGENGRDLLLFLLDQGLALHQAGKFKESIAVFQRADKIAEIKDYTSLTAEAATLLTSDNIKDYRGEDFEKVLIPVYQALNFASLGDYEGARVEARKVNRILHLMKSEGGRAYEQSPFAHYISGILFEADGDYGNAYVSYKKVRELRPEYPEIGRDLWRMAWLERNTEDQRRWKRDYGLTDADIERERLRGPRSDRGEIIVVYQNGRAPKKKPHPDFYQVPIFVPQPNPHPFARVQIVGEGNLTLQDAGQTAVLHDIEASAIQNLNEKWGGILAKKLAGIAAKEIVADQIRKGTGSDLAGAAARLFFYLSDQADLRSWYLLPRDLQLLRIPVDPGRYTVRVTPEGGAMLPEKSVDVRRRQRVWVGVR